MSKATSTGGAGETTTETGGGTESNDDITADDVFELLSSHRRRYALHYLKHNDQCAEVGELAERIASWETEQPVSEVKSDERKNVYTSLQQFHLPKLNENGIVEYDRRAGRVELTEAADGLDVYLEVVREWDIPWSQYYLGLAGINAGLIAAIAAGVWPLTALPNIAWSVFIVVTFAVSAVVHLYHGSLMRLGSNEKPPELRD